MSQQTTDRARFDAWFATLQDPGADFAWEAWQAATRAERERCAKLVETQDRYGDPVQSWFDLLAAKIRSQP